MQSNSSLRTALMLGAFALTLGLTSVAQAEGGDAFSGRYELFLKQEQKRDLAQTVDAEKDYTRSQKAGDVPVSPGATKSDAKDRPFYTFDRNHQHLRGR